MNDTEMQIAAENLSYMKPSVRADAIVKIIQNQTNWKQPTALGYVTSNKAMADEVADALTWYMGGAEIATKVLFGDTEYHVTSKGYYHYVGC